MIASDAVGEAPTLHSSPIFLVGECTRVVVHLGQRVHLSVVPEYLLVHTCNFTHRRRFLWAVCCVRSYHQPLWTAAVCRKCLSAGTRRQTGSGLVRASGRTGTSHLRYNPQDLNACCAAVPYDHCHQTIGWARGTDLDEQKLWAVKNDAKS